MCGTLPPLSHISSWRGAYKPYSAERQPSYAERV